MYGMVYKCIHSYSCKIILSHMYIVHVHMMVQGQRSELQEKNGQLQEMENLREENSDLKELVDLTEKERNVSVCDCYKPSLHV